MQYGMSMARIIERKMQNGPCVQPLRERPSLKNSTLVVYPENDDESKGFFVYNHDGSQYFGALVRPGSRLQAPHSHHLVEFPLEAVQIGLSLRKESPRSARSAYFDCIVSVKLVYSDGFLQNNPTKEKFTVVARSLMLRAFYELPNDDRLLMNPGFLEMCFSKSLNDIGAKVERVDRMVKTGSPVELSSSPSQTVMWGP